MDPGTSSEDLPEERVTSKKRRKHTPQAAKKITIPISKSVFLLLYLFYHYTYTYLKGYNTLECFFIIIILLY